MKDGTGFHSSRQSSGSRAVKAKMQKPIKRAGFSSQSRHHLLLHSHHERRQTPLGGGRCSSTSRGSHSFGAIPPHLICTCAHPDNRILAYDPSASLLLLASSRRSPTGPLATLLVNGAIPLLGPSPAVKDLYEGSSSDSGIARPKLRVETGEWVTVIGWLEGTIPDRLIDVCTYFSTWSWEIICEADRVLSSIPVTPTCPPSRSSLISFIYRQLANHRSELSSRARLHESSTESSNLR
jgi:hypothetical protein